MFLSIGWGRVDGPGTSADAGGGPSPFLAERWGVASIASGVAGAELSSARHATGASRSTRTAAHAASPWRAHSSAAQP